MKEKCKIICLVTEVMQWVLIVMLGIMVWKMAALPGNTRMSQDLDELKQEEVYRQIYNDHRLKRLANENQALVDSIEAINEGEKCTGIHYIVVRDTIFIGDTIYFKK